MFLVVVVPLDLVLSEKELLVLVLACNNVLTGRNNAQLAKILWRFPVVIGNG